MVIDGVDGEFVVCKLRRVSSPPVHAASVSESLESSFQRLVDIIRLGRCSQNFLDLQAIEWLLKEDFGTDAVGEWADYERVICRSLGVDHLEPLVPAMPTTTDAAHTLPTITFHQGKMNDRPYLVARVGTIFGAPAPVLLTQPHEQESALARLKDVFRIGVRGQAFRDHVEAERKRGITEAEVVGTWQACDESALRSALDGM
jgi:hypothetical protein